MSEAHSDVATPSEILEFWFGTAGVPDTVRVEWFRKDPAFDAVVRERFGATVAAGLAAGLQHWRRPGSDARTRLAHLLVLDQFTRNIHRDTPLAFAGDWLALDAARELVSLGFDRALAPLERWFAYLPFEHAESLEEQARSLVLFAGLRDDPLAGGAWEWAVRHAEVIRRFGRYPHRNELLGRTDTDAERTFLTEPGSRF